MAGEELNDPRLLHVLSRSRHSLEQVGAEPNTQAWVKSCASTEPGTDKLLRLLEEHVSEPSFLHSLESARAESEAAGQPDPTPPAGGGDQAPPHSHALQADWWELKPDGDFASVSEDTGDYVVVEHADAVAAMSHFIAAYIVTLPEAASCDSRQLQKALAETIQELRKGRVRRLLDWGRTIYRAVAVSYGAFSAYTNPWLAKAVLTALLTAVRMLAGLVVL
ncbi:hypothetical protein ACKKBG_A24460 [Auxenochlorella protothecoides x Auxenochlorella symbiontica]